MSHNDKPTMEQLREMAKLTLVSNQINEIQIKNLKMFPLVFFDGVSKVSIDYDLSNQQTFETEENKKDLEISYKFNKDDNKHFRVSYYLTIDDTENTMIQKRFAALESSVRGLFWNQVAVQVFFNGKLAYESVKNVRE